MSEIDLSAETLPTEASIWASAVASSLVDTLPEKIKKTIPDSFKASVARCLTVERQRADKAEQFYENR